MERISELTFTEEGLPIISLKKYFEGDIYEKQNVVESIATACQTVGCFMVADVGVDWKIVENCFEDMNSFFQLSVEQKMKHRRHNPNEDDRGYVPYETQNVSAFMGRQGFPNDPLEKYAFGPITQCPFEAGKKHLDFVQSWTPNVYPEYPKSTEQNIKQYITSVTTLAENLMKIFSTALNMPEDFIFDHCNFGAHSLKVNFYPMVDNPKQNQDRFAEHTDSTPFTIVCPDQSQYSLMVKNVNGDWIYANSPPKTFFVNLGDTMSRWTNDKWVATPHKVVFPPKSLMTDRLSFVFFVLMNQDAIMNCMPSCLDKNGSSKYEPISYAEYTSSKMKNLINTKNY